MKEISKNTLEKIRIEKREYKGREFIDIRTYYLDGNEWKPTQKGVTFRPDQLKEIIEALESERTRRPLEGSSLPPGGRKE